MNWELVLLGASVFGGAANLFIGLMIAKQSAEVKVWVAERYVAKTDFMDLMQLLGLPERPRKAGDK